MKILLALDPSAAGEAALREIATRPWPAGATFEVVSVVEPSHLWTSSEVARQAASSAEKLVRLAIEQIQPKGHTATGAALSGDPKTLILERAKSIGAGFIIVSAHVGVSGAVVRYAPCSVEIVRARIQTQTRGNWKVLLATDGSEYSQKAALSVAERPWTAGTEFRVLSVVEFILPATRALFEPPFLDASFIENARMEAMKRSQEAITRARETLSAAGLDASESISVLLDTPKAIILDEAVLWGADLIVLGSHGRHGVERFLLGSVSETIATHAECSVEVIR